MEDRDFSEYEKRRAEDHEKAWRYASTLVNIRSRHCRYRHCRRIQICCGPMRPSVHQHGVIRAHLEIGLSGTACADLPLCMANATAERYAHVLGVCKKLAALRVTEFKDLTPLGYLNLLHRVMRRQHRERSADLTSLPRQPTSEARHEG